MRQPQLGPAARLSIGAIREAHRTFVSLSNLLGERQSDARAVVFVV